MLAYKLNSIKSQNVIILNINIYILISTCKKYLKLKKPTTFNHTMKPIVSFGIVFDFNYIKHLVSIR